MYKFILFCLLAITATANAQYQPHSIWSREGARDSSLYGFSILALGDQNNDGYNDWAVVAVGNHNNTWHGAQQGYIEFFHGGNPLDAFPYMVQTIDTTTEFALGAAYAVGDLNGDGYVDWEVAAELNDGSFRSVWKIYFGGPSPHNNPDLVLPGPWFSLYYGIGDFNGDGFDDLFFENQFDEYSTILFGGSPMDTLPDWHISGDLAIFSYGHVNHDRFSDITCYNNDTGNMGIFFGAESPDTAPAYSWPSISLLILADINRDGFDDIGYRGTGYTSIARGGDSLRFQEDARINFDCSGYGPMDFMSAGDFNHDGFNDIVMVDPWCENSYEGVLTVHLGGYWINPRPAFTIYGGTGSFNLWGIKTAVNLGDINGDQIDDLAIGANDDLPYAGWRGKVVILGGDSSLHVGVDPVRPELPQSLEITAYPNPFNATTTISFTLPKTEHVDLNVDDVTGRLVRSLAGGHIGPPLQAGQHDVEFDGSDLTSGIYFARMQAGTFSQTRKMVLLK